VPKYLVDIVLWGVGWLALGGASQLAAQPASDANLVGLSQALLLKVKLGEPTATELTTLENLPAQALADLLPTQDQRLAFWMNLYNAFAQIVIANQDLSQPRVRRQIFGKKQFGVGGQTLSLNAIEHRIIRRSQVLWGLGYLSAWPVKKWERNWRVFQREPRIHFALNCGATSCPPIAFYDSQKLDQQFNIATIGYLAQNIEVDTVNSIIYLPKVFLWFRGDFGKKKQLLEFLLRHEIRISSDIKYSFRYRNWDWNASYGCFL
jgi:hypothetical protein